jgi:hypothetical protein
MPINTPVKENSSADPRKSRLWLRNWWVSKPLSGYCCATLVAFFRDVRYLRIALNSASAIR